MASKLGVVLSGPYITNCCSGSGSTINGSGGVFVISSSGEERLCLSCVKLMRCSASGGGSIVVVVVVVVVVVACLLL